MQASPAEYKRQKRESQVQKIPWKTWTQQSKTNAKGKKLLTENIKEIQDKLRKPNLRIISIEESEDSQLKGPVNIFNKIIEENSLNLKKRDEHEYAGSLQNSKQIGPEKKLLLSHNNQNTKCTKQRKNIKSSRGKRSRNI